MSDIESPRQTGLSVGAVIPDEAVRAALSAYDIAWDCDVNGEESEWMRAALEAALPAIRLAVLREEISLGDQWQIDDPRIRYVDVQVGKETYLEVHGGRS